MFVLLLALNAAAVPWPTGGPTIPLNQRFPAPDGFVRAPVEGYAAWLRALPVRTDRVQVLAFDGRPLDRPAAALVALDVGRRDLQQCADTAIRLHAEWLWDTGRPDAAAYHFTSGDRTAWRDWQAGERFAIRGSRVERSVGPTRPNTHAEYRAWLDLVFTYAGTRSLALDTEPVDSGGVGGTIQGGDLFVQGGSPGHAVIVLDVAVGPDGERVALMGQGFMPAEDLHVLTAPHARDGIWFALPEQPDDLLVTPSWAPFRRSEARRFE